MKRFKCNRRSQNTGLCLMKLLVMFYYGLCSCQSDCTHPHGCSCLDQQGEPSSAGNEQGVERLLTWCSVQRSPGRQNLTGGQFVVESIEHLQDVGFSCATTGQM